MIRYGAGTSVHPSAENLCGFSSASQDKPTSPGGGGGPGSNPGPTRYKADVLGIRHEAAPCPSGDRFKLPLSLTLKDRPSRQKVSKVNINVGNTRYFGAVFNSSMQHKLILRIGIFPLASTLS